MYTYQHCAEPGVSFVPGAELHHAQSHAELRAALEEWADFFSSRKDAFLLVWHGYHTDVANIYPDFTVRFGPRKGIHLYPA